MKKTRGFLLAAGISLALAFTFSCSSDDGEPSGGNTSSSSVVGGGGGSSSSVGDNGGGGTPPVPSTTSDGYQTYKVPDGEQIYKYDKNTGKTSPYTERGKVNLYGTSIEMGTIETGGKLSLTFSAPLDNYNDDGDGYSKQWLSAGECELTLKGSPEGMSKATRDDLVEVSFFYVSEEVPAEGKDFTDDEFETLKLKRGWNFVYEKKRNYTVEQPEDLKWEWIIDCPNNDPDPH